MFPDTGDFLERQISKEHLYVQVAYFGDNLNEELIRNNLQLSDGRSILLFHWTPSVLLQNFDLTNVAFPDCRIDVRIISQCAQ